MSEEREILTREVPISISEDGDGRTIDARLVPYGVQASVADPPTYEPYLEEFVQGSFDRQVKAPDRIKVWLNFEHMRGLPGIIGHGVSLSEREDGLYGSFRVHNGPDGDKALSLIEDGVLGGMSIEFAALKSRTVSGVVQRLRAIVDKASLTMVGKEAYQGAQVLAVREAPDEDPPEMPAEPPRQPEDGEFGDSGTQFVSIEPAGESTEAGERAQIVDGLLERIGYTPILMRSVTKKPWDGSAARFDDEQYARSCLIDRGGDAPAKERCSLPVLEPNGDVNANALAAASAALAGGRGGVSAPMELKAKAARKLMRYYRQAAMDPPASLRMMAAK